jgi:hypothetical protein
MQEQFPQLVISQLGVLEDLPVDAALQVLVPVDRDGEEPAIGVLQDVVAPGDPFHGKANFLQRLDHRFPRRGNQAASWTVKVTMVRAE